MPPKDADEIAKLFEAVYGDAPTDKKEEITKLFAAVYGDGPYIDTALSHALVEPLLLKGPALPTPTSMISQTENLTTTTNMSPEFVIPSGLPKNFDTGWSPVDALCEFFRNARDEEVASEHMADVASWGDPANGPHAVTITNHGVSPIVPNDPKALWESMFILGLTTRPIDPADGLFGHRGEGLKFACHALLKSGYPVEFQFHSPNQKPILASPEWSNNEMKFYGAVSSIQKPSTEFKFVVRVEGVSANQFNKAWDRCEWLSSKYAHTPRLKTREATVLLDHKELGGHIYVNGYLVSRKFPTYYGYSLSGVRLGRDGRLPSDFDLFGKLKKVWAELKAQFETLLLPTQSGPYTEFLVYLDGSTPTSPPPATEGLLDPSMLTFEETHRFAEARLSLFNGATDEASLEAVVQIVDQPLFDFSFDPSKGLLQIGRNHLTSSHSTLVAILKAMAAASGKKPNAEVALRLAASAMLKTYKQSDV